MENRVTGHQPSAVKDFGRRPPNLGTEKEASGMVRKGQGPLPTGPLCPSERQPGWGSPRLISGRPWDRAPGPPSWLPHKVRSVSGITHVARTTAQPLPCRA